MQQSFNKWYDMNNYYKWIKVPIIINFILIANNFNVVVYYFAKRPQLYKYDN